MKAAIYCRRSTDHQEGSLGVQEQEARKYVAAHGWEIAQVYIDDAISRAEYKKRPALYALLNAAQRGEFQVIVIRDIDRLGGDTNRNGVILSDLIDRGVQVHEYMTNNVVKLDSAIAKFMSAAKNFAAEIEREKTSQRVHEALKSKAARGKVAGGKVYGYANVRSPDGVDYAIDPEQAAVIREMFAWYIGGAGVKGIARKLNARKTPSPWAGKRGTGSWSFASVYGVLNNERYRGVLHYGRMKKGYRGGTKVRDRREDKDVLVIERPELAIITAQIWDASRGRKNKLTKPWHVQTGGTPRYLLTGLAVCAVCGGGMRAHHNKYGSRSIPHYMCSYWHDRGSEVCTNNLKRPQEKVDAAVLAEIQKICRHDAVASRIIAAVRERLTVQAAGSDSEVQRLSKVVARLQREVGNLTEAIAMGGLLSSLVAKLQQVQGELTLAEQQLSEARHAPGVLARGLDGLAEEVRDHLAQTSTLLQDEGKAKDALRKLLAGKMSLRPLDTAEGRRYEISGRLSIGALLVHPESIASLRG